MVKILNWFKLVNSYSIILNWFRLVNSYSTILNWFKLVNSYSKGEANSAESVLYSYTSTTSPI